MNIKNLSNFDKEVRQLTDCQTYKSFNLFKAIV